MKSLVIEKPNSDVVCWKVETEGISYNTELTIGDNVTILINYNGHNIPAMSGKNTLGGLINPSKDKKFFGGGKEISCKIFALDERNEFSAEWGKGDITCIDPENKIRHMAQAHGSYSFKIFSLEDFLGTSQFSSVGILTSNDVKKALRERINVFITDAIANELNKSGLYNCQCKLIDIATKIKDTVNKEMRNSGMRFDNFTIARLAYSEEDAKIEKVFNDKQINITLNRMDNTISHDNINVVRDYIDATAPIQQNGDKNDEDVKRYEEKTIICPFCKEPNEYGSIYCKKCNGRLVK